LDRKVAYCRNTFPLNKLNASNQASLRYCLNECHFVRNDVVIAHGKESNSVFFVVEGQFTVSMVTPTESEEGVREMTLCTLSAGESFGEHELLTREGKHGLIPTRQYTVTTSSATGAVMQLPREFFFRCKCRITRTIRTPPCLPYILTSTPSQSCVRGWLQSFTSSAYSKWKPGASLRLFCARI
jgi:CRP-like cAMP-binding protein